MDWSVILHSAAARGAVTGLVSAAGVDIHAFVMWKSAHDAVTYNWGVAAWRWFQGAVTGAIAGAGYGALVS